MTKVIQDIFGISDVKGSRKRPDFAIVPDGTVGLYSLPRYGDDGGEIGIERLTIIELKKPEVPIGDEQKNQAWNYVKKLLSKGLLKSYSTVNCFVLGTELVAHEGSLKVERDVVRILPLEYDMVMRRGKSRLLNLYDKVKNAPFLQDARARQFMLEKA